MIARGKLRVPVAKLLLAVVLWSLAAPALAAAPQAGGVSRPLPFQLDPSVLLPAASPAPRATGPSASQPTGGTPQCDKSWKAYTDPNSPHYGQSTCYDYLSHPLYTKALDGGDSLARRFQADANLSLIAAYRLPNNPKKWTRSCFGFSYDECHDVSGDHPNRTYWDSIHYDPATDSIKLEQARIGHTNGYDWPIGTGINPVIPIKPDWKKLNLLTVEADVLAPVTYRKRGDYGGFQVERYLNTDDLRSRSDGKIVDNDYSIFCLWPGHSKVQMWGTTFKDVWYSPSIWNPYGLVCENSYLKLSGVVVPDKNNTAGFPAESNGKWLHIFVAYEVDYRQWVEAYQTPDQVYPFLPGEADELILGLGFMPTSPKGLQIRNITVKGWKDRAAGELFPEFARMVKYRNSHDFPPDSGSPAGTGDQPSGAMPGDAPLDGGTGKSQNQVGFALPVLGGGCPDVHGFTFILNGSRCLSFSDLRLINDRIVVPLRELVDQTKPASMQEDILAFSSAEKVAWVFPGGVLLGLPWDKDAALFDGMKIPLDVHAFGVGGRTYAPLRAVMDALGVGVSYEDETHTIHLDSSKPWSYPRHLTPSQACWLHGFDGDNLDRCNADAFLIGSYAYRSFGADRLALLMLQGALDVPGVKYWINRIAMIRKGEPINFHTSLGEAYDKVMDDVLIGVTLGELLKGVEDLAEYYKSVVRDFGGDIPEAERVIDETGAALSGRGSQARGKPDGWYDANRNGLTVDALQYQGRRSGYSYYIDSAGDVRIREYAFAETSFDGRYVMNQNGRQVEVLLEAKSDATGWLQRLQKSGAIDENAFDVEACKEVYNQAYAIVRLRGRTDMLLDWDFQTPWLEQRYRQAWDNKLLGYMEQQLGAEEGAELYHQFQRMIRIKVVP